MKNQYFGDLGDYGKYGLLRYLASNNIRIAVNWYLIPDDSSNDGKHISYLEKGDMRKYDPALFDVLKAMVDAGQRDVMAFEDKDMIPNAVYYNHILHNEGETKAAPTQTARSTRNISLLLSLSVFNLFGSKLVLDRR